MAWKPTSNSLKFVQYYSLVKGKIKVHCKRRSTLYFSEIEEEPCNWSKQDDSIHVLYIWSSDRHVRELTCG